jgi:predicted RND superfamily exporter protein
MGKEKKRRNVIYRSCGIVMILAIGCITVYTIFFRRTFLAAINPVLILESVALVAFGISWLVKGHTLFKDKRK